MATLLELATIQEQSGWNDFHSGVIGAVLVKAASVIDEPTPNVGTLDWAKGATASPTIAADALVGYVVGTNSSASVTAILTANDAAIQSNVDAAVDKLYGT